jgi:hypothetical protein
MNKHTKRGGPTKTRPNPYNSATQQSYYKSWHIPNISREFETSVANFQGYARIQLEAADIDLSVIKKLPFGKIGYMRAAINFDEGYFEPDPKLGYSVFIIATGYTPGGFIEDIVAFSLKAPTKHWLRNGFGEYLGDPFSSLQHVDITRFLQDGAVGCVKLEHENG